MRLQARSHAPAGHFTLNPLQQMPGLHLGAAPRCRLLPRLPSLWRCLPSGAPTSGHARTPRRRRTWSASGDHKRRRRNSAVRELQVVGRVRKIRKWRHKQSFPEAIGCPLYAASEDGPLLRENAMAAICATACQTRRLLPTKPAIVAMPGFARASICGDLARLAPLLRAGRRARSGPHPSLRLL